MKFLELQTRLKAPKGHYNTFGKFHYRSCSDILEAAKPLLAEMGLILTFTEDILLLDKRFFVKSTATIREGDEGFSCTSFAGLAFDRISDAAQATGAATSYARKYALCGLLLIDDGEDNDSIASPAPTAAAVAAAMFPAASPASPPFNLPPQPPGVNK